MEYPTVHLNGTSKQALLDQQIDAINALRVAASAMRAASPHQRDYYVKKDQAVAWARAREEHVLRLRAIDALINELTEIAKEVADQ